MSLFLNVTGKKFVNLTNLKSSSICYFPIRIILRWFHVFSFFSVAAFFLVDSLKILFYFMLKIKSFLNVDWFVSSKISRWWILLKHAFFNFVFRTRRFRINSIGNMFRITSSIVFRRSHIRVQISYRRYNAFRSEQSWIFWKEKNIG